MHTNFPSLTNCNEYQAQRNPAKSTIIIIDCKMFKMQPTLVSRGNFSQVLLNHIYSILLQNYQAIAALN
jgi:hypothetical protein